MWKNQGSWNFFHTKLIPNSSIICTFAVKNITNVSIYGTYYTYNQREESLSYGN